MIASSSADLHEESLAVALTIIQEAREDDGKPLGVVLAGHNGSGKSTLWHQRLAKRMRMPLINADRMMMSILPEPDRSGHLVPWARSLRDGDEAWKRVSQQGVQSFIAHAIARKVPFAFETVFSHWRQSDDGTVESKLDLLRQMRQGGYFVLLVFVGLASAELSVARVQTRVRKGGHGIPAETLHARFPRTQKAIAAALTEADAAILLDNSGAEADAFSLCLIQEGQRVLFDARNGRACPPYVAAWLSRVAPS